MKYSIPRAKQTYFHSISTQMAINGSLHSPGAKKVDPGGEVRPPGPRGPPRVTMCHDEPRSHELTCKISCKSDQK